MNAVNAIVVPNGKSTTRPLYQWDYGQRLILLGYELPETYEVHFSNTEDGTATIQIGDSSGVDIPDTYLTTGSDVWAWLYLHTGSADGETKATIRIPVRKRAQPTGGSPTPAQQDTITQAIALLNTAVEETSADAESAHADAERAETAAENLEGVVRYTAQELTAEQQAQARTNIGVTTPILMVDVSYTNGAYVPSKTCLEIYEAYTAGAYVILRQASANIYWFPLIYAMSYKQFGKRMVELKFGRVEYTNATTGTYLGFNASLDESSTETWSYKNYTITWRA